MSGASRERILAAIRAARGAADDDAGVEARLTERPRGPLPDLGGDDLEALLVARLEVAVCTVASVASEQAIGVEVQHWLAEQGAEQALVRASGPLLDAVVWPDALAVSIAGQTVDRLSTVTEAFCAVAETGSLVLLSSPESPTALNFLPDNFICVLRRARIVRHIEDAWDLIRAETDGMPRAMNLVTGPSRTADVEQTIQLGAHGPRRLHVLLFG